MNGAENRIQRLCDLTRECANYDAVRDIGNAGLDALFDLYTADAGVIARSHNGRLFPIASHADMLQHSGIYTTSHGLAGRTLAEQTVLTVDDTRNHPDTKPTDNRYRSVLSAPLEDGVVQLFSTELGKFAGVDSLDIEQVCAILNQAFDRIDSEHSSERGQNQLSALFDNLPDPAVRCTHHLDSQSPVIDDVNSAFVDIFGYEAPEVVGESLVEVIVPSDVESPLEASTDPTRCHSDPQVERQVTTGRRRFLLRHVPIAKDVSQSYFIYTDVEPLKRREEELQRQNERLDRFADIVSHDLRNPLSIAQGYLDKIPETADTEAPLENIGDALARMDTIIKDTLIMARSAQPIEERVAVNGHAVAMDAWWGVSSDSAELITTDEWVITADKSRLKQLFENLFRNAVQHAGENVTVTVGALDDGGFYVEDDGPGIPPSDRERVFEPGDSTGSGDSGLGLGLTIVSEIVDAHHWEITVTESSSGGARFEIRDGKQSTAQPIEDTVEVN